MRKIIQTNIVDCPGAEETGLLVWVQTEDGVVISRYYTIHPHTNEFYWENEGRVSVPCSILATCISEAIQDASESLEPRKRRPSLYESVFLTTSDMTAAENRVAESLNRVFSKDKLLNALDDAFDDAFDEILMTDVEEANAILQEAGLDPDEVGASLEK